MYITRTSSGIARIAIIIDQQKRPQDVTVARPCTKNMAAMNRMKNMEHKKYDTLGSTPRASKIHDTSHEKAIR